MFIICLFIVLFFGLSAPKPKPTVSLPSADSPVVVDFYGESLCPDCRHMVLDILSPMFDDRSAELMQLQYIAWGKVRRSGKTITCQHGEKECRYNRYINCAPHLNPDQSSWFPYIKCLAQDLQHIEEKSSECAASAGFDPAALDSCVSGALGDELEKQAGDKSESLPHQIQFVPWVVVNGVELEMDFENLKKYVCAASNATHRSQSCGLV